MVEYNEKTAMVIIFTLQRKKSWSFRIIEFLPENKHQLEINTCVLSYFHRNPGNSSAWILIFSFFNYNIEQQLPMWMFSLGRRHFIFVILCQDALLFTISHLHVFPKSLIQGFKSTLAASSVLACCFELGAALVYFFSAVWKYKL